MVRCPSLHITIISLGHSSSVSLTRNSRRYQKLINRENTAEDFSVNNLEMPACLLALNQRFVLEPLGYLTGEMPKRITAS